MEYRRIIAHTDFDGVASAALCLMVYGSLDILFAGPNEIYSRIIIAEPGDIVVDLPYASGCGIWFDHHAGNMEDLKLLGVDPASVPGKHEEAPSCARVIYSRFKDEFAWPEFIPELIDFVDRVDSFAYADIDDWMRETPDRIINLALRTQFENRRELYSFLKDIAHRIKSKPLTELIKDDDIVEKYRRSVIDEEKSLNLVNKGLRWADNGADRILLLDFLDYKQPIRLNKSLAFIKERDAHAVLSVTPMFNRGVKTTDFSVSASLSISAPKNTYDLGEIMRSLNIGDGHPGAAAGKVSSKDKATMLSNRKKILDEIISAMNKQRLQAPA